ncbi:MAG: M14 family zinc carboxypeptidase [Saprospiraceae bacterium]
MRTKFTYFVFSIFILLFFSNISSAQSQTKYSRAKVFLYDNSLNDIASLGLDVEHGTLAKGRFIISDFSNNELELLSKHGINYEILIDDVQKHYVEQNLNVDNKNIESRTVLGNCNNDDYERVFDTPENYTYGSMGGYLTYDELLVVLDSMVAKYPNIISQKQQIDTILTYEGNPIYWVKVSNNPNEDEDKPEILYTALHHAREPVSLSQMIFYLWYLLENYDTDPEIKFLVDNVEMYFIPCVNPDGYIYNHTTNPQGGGEWRKNRWRKNGTIYGVDLNRNYGYQWGYDDIGSSTDPQDETYRGESAFSEPETRAVRKFCQNHSFSLAVNYHTYGNLLIHPWGYNDSETDKNDVFTAIGNGMTKYNNFLVGTGTSTVGYTSNGDSDDWMFGDTITKESIITFTSEVGNQDDGFWLPNLQLILIIKHVCIKILWLLIAPEII